MEDAGKRAKGQSAAKRKVYPLWVRFIHYSIRQSRKRKAEKQPETPADKASRRTANATIAIAFFTLVLVIVSYFQWKEIHDGGKDTHNLAVAAGEQATWTQNLAANMQTQADRTKDLADRMKDQADRTKDLGDQTKNIADHALTQAEAARKSADIARDTFMALDRPYVGTANIVIFFESPRPDGSLAFTETRQKDSTGFLYRVEIKNFGSVAGIEYRTSWKIFLDGIQLNTSGPNTKPTTIYPSESLYLTGRAGPDIFPPIMTSKSILQLEISTEYDGPKEHYKECTKAQFFPQSGNFTNLGPCPAQKAN